MNQELQEKFNKLKVYMKDLESVLVAYSGGVDSTLLIKVASEVLGERAIAVTASSETYPSRELKDANEYAGVVGINHRVIHTSELEIAGFSENPPDRCYFCKHELFTKLRQIADENNVLYILDGSNFDDQNDHRPGMKAAKELGVKSPLKETGFTKDDIRELSKFYQLPSWNKPSFACLSSRFPYGTQITPDKLVVLDEAEEFIRELGFNELRVRHHDTIARIEISTAEFQRFLAVADSVNEKLTKLGFLYVALDLAGYKTGSMNLSLKEEELCKNTCQEV